VLSSNGYFMTTSWRGLIRLKSEGSREYKSRFWWW